MHLQVRRPLMQGDMVGADGQQSGILPKNLRSLAWREFAKCDRFVSVLPSVSQG